MHYLKSPRVGWATPLDRGKPCCGSCLWWSGFVALTAFAGYAIPGTEIVLIGFGVLIAMQFLFGMGEAGAFPNISKGLYNWFSRQRTRLRTRGGLAFRPIHGRIDAGDLGGVGGNRRTQLVASPLAVRWHRGALVPVVLHRVPQQTRGTPPGPIKRNATSLPKANPNKRDTTGFHGKRFSRAAMFGRCV